MPRNCSRLTPAFAPAEAITHFARATGCRAQRRRGCRTGRHRQAEGTARTLEKANQGYWAEQVEIQVLGAQALAHAGPRRQGGGAEVHACRRRPRGRSEKHVAMENRLYPMRELLADMLLAAARRWQRSRSTSCR